MIKVHTQNFKNFEKLNVDDKLFLASLWGPGQPSKGIAGGEGCGIMYELGPLFLDDAPCGSFSGLVLSAVCQLIFS